MKGPPLSLSPPPSSPPLPFGLAPGNLSASVDFEYSFPLAAWGGNMFAIWLGWISNSTEERPLIATLDTTKHNHRPVSRTTRTSQRGEVQNGSATTGTAQRTDQ